MFADITMGEDGFTVTLENGRSAYAPYAWYPRLRDATPAQRQKWTPFGDNAAIWWPEIDEHLSVESIMEGRPAYQYIKERKAQ